MTIQVSIIVTTRNRSAQLRQTLESFQCLQVPKELPAELLVVDNASTDDTAAVIKAACLPRLRLRYLHEPQPGKSNALNSGLANTSGEIILFTDDDVRPCETWLQAMALGLGRNSVSVVAGLVRMASHLQRPWMSDLHRGYLASIGSVAARPDLVGANMGIRRDVLRKVSAFDPELGSGAMGNGEDTLFGFQLNSAGFPAHGVPEAVVEHHFAPERLQRPSWLDAAERRGRSRAYIDHHWFHLKVPNINFKTTQRWAKLALWRLSNMELCKMSEGCSEAELSRIRGLSYLRQFKHEQRRIPKYGDTCSMENSAATLVAR